MRLLLASRSATRRAMLAAAGVPFDVVEAPLDEEAAKAGLAAAGVTGREMASRLAELKARSAAYAGGLVLGADQVLERDDGLILGKPGSRAEAFDQLSGLGGRRHSLHSAASVVERGVAVWSATETATLSVRPLSRDFLEDYLDREYEAVRWNVGAYRIEGMGAQLFDSVEGSHFAVLGLPLLPLLAFLRSRGILAH